MRRSREKNPMMDVEKSPERLEEVRKKGRQGG